MKTNRLCIYVLSDKDGIVDDFIPYWLNALSEFVSHYVIVCNGVINTEGIAKLQKFTSDLFFRDNIGFDAGAIKDALENLFGWEKVLQYDEVLICNDTFYGPFYPLSELFGKMENQDVDFWGITEHGDFVSRDDSFPRHLQSYFVNFNKAILHSQDFVNFFANLKAIENKNQLVHEYEVALSQTLSSKGYVYGAYIDSSAFISDFPEYNYNYYVFDAYETISKYRCPILKKHAVWNAHAPISMVGSEHKNELFPLLHNLGFNTKLIWDNALRLFNITQIYRSMRLNYILDTNLSVAPTDKKSVLIIVHISYESLVDECLGYLFPLRDNFDIVITTSNDHVYKQMSDNGFNVRKIENRGRDFSALLVFCKDLLMKYEYVCFTHDKKSITQKRSPRTADSFRYLLFENTLASKHYVFNVLKLFSDNQQLGFLGIPSPYHSTFFGRLISYWDDDYQGTVELLEQLGINVPIDEDWGPIAIGTAFWCRSAALKTLFEYDWKVTDFPPEPVPVDGVLNHFIERAFPYVAQHEGYYSATVMSARYAGVRLTDFEVMLGGILCNINRKYLISDGEGLAQFWDFIDSKLLIPFIGSVSKIFIYGAGIYGRRVDKILRTNGIEYLGFIVSDGQPKQREHCGHKVYYLSEIDNFDDVGIILALDRRHTFEVMPIVEKLPVKLIHY